MKGKHMQEGPGDDLQIQIERPVLAVLDVRGHAVLDLAGIIHRTTMSTHLGQAGHTRLHRVAHRILAAFHGEEHIVFCHVGARPDDGHVTEQNVEELRHFIDAELPHQPATSEDTRVIGTSLDAFSAVIDRHGAEFIDPELLALKTGPHLRKYHRPAHFNLNSDRQRQKHRRQHNQGRQ